MNHQHNFLHRVGLKSCLSSAFVLAFVAVWTLAGTMLGEAAAQMRNQDGVKAKAASVQKTTPKSSPQKASKTVSSPKATAQPTQPKILSGQSLIVTGFNVYIRENSSTSAESKGQLRFGTIVRATEHSEKPDTVGSKQSFWHRIALPDGKSGWVFGAFLKPFDQSSRENVYQQITAEKFKAPNLSFDENAELYEFLTRAQTEVKTATIASQIGLWRLLSLKNALKAIPFDKMEGVHYKDFTDKNSIHIVYSEPGGQWLVRSERFWSLSKRYAGLPVGEKSAWEAAQNPLPGECEGYLNCRLFMLRETYGEYLARFPKAAHAAESLKVISDDLALIVADIDKKEFYNAPVDVSDLADFYKKIAELRSIVSLTGFFEKEAILRQLNKIAEGYR